jgi:1,2-diacylglycerol 3-alpha-glucosyltransferase
MNICFVLDEYDGMGGIGVNARSLAKKLTIRGHKVIVITGGGNFKTKYQIKEGIKIYRTKSIFLYHYNLNISIASTKELIKILDINKVQIVHIQTVSPIAKVAYKSAQILNLKKVFTYNMLPEHYSSNSILGKIMSNYIKNSIKKICKKCDLVICPATEILKEIKKINSNSIYLSNCCDFEELKKEEKIQTNGKFILTYIGRLANEKNIKILIKALYLLNNNNYELWIIGDGFKKRELIKLSKKLNIINQIKFLGFHEHSELGKFYNSCDVFILPSLYETQGMVVLEAMYFGKPVIITDSIISAKDLVENGKNGFIVKYNSTKQLANRIKLLKENKQLYIKMGKESKIKSRKYNSNMILDKLENKYKSLFN